MKNPKEYMAFRAPPEFLGAIAEAAASLEISESELCRRAIEKGIKEAVDEIQEEKIASAKKLMKRLKVKGPGLNFEIHYAPLIPAVA